MAKQGRGAGGASKVVPKVVLKGSEVLADRLVFSADGRVLMVSGEMLESHAWDLATGKPLMSETIGDAMADLANMAGDIQKRLESASPDELAGGDFSSIVAAAMGGKVLKGGGGGAMADIMNMELGGPKLTAVGEAYVKGLDGPTGLEALDLAAGLIRKPGPVFRLLSPDGRRYAGMRDGGTTIEFYEAKTGKRLGQSVGKAHSTLSPMAFSPDGSLLSGEVDAGKAAVWSVPDGKRLRTLAGMGMSCRRWRFRRTESGWRRRGMTGASGSGMR